MRNSSAQRLDAPYDRELELGRARARQTCKTTYTVFMPQDYLRRPKQSKLQAPIGRSILYVCTRIYSAFSLVRTARYGRKVQVLRLPCHSNWKSVPVVFGTNSRQEKAGLDRV